MQFISVSKKILFSVNLKHFKEATTVFMETHVSLRLLLTRMRISLKENDKPAPVQLNLSINSICVYTEQMLVFGN